MLYIACFIAGFIAFPIIGGVFLWALFADEEYFTSFDQERDL